MNKIIVNTSNPNLSWIALTLTIFVFLVFIVSGTQNENHSKFAQAQIVNNTVESTNENNNNETAPTLANNTLDIG
ncbi:MAG TPA: hypothetical protein VJ799_11500, partial [Nitrososphaeraceae archaeon]|nr:hypothetical protein [Nitrososphaeraceae archaeon]